MMLKRRKAKRFGSRVNEGPIRCPSHLAWLRGHVCAIDGDLCLGKMEAAHVRTGTDGGMGKKPSDCFAIPLCADHHAYQHRIGEAAFERKYGIDMKAIASDLWARSPAGIKHYEARLKDDRHRAHIESDY